MKTLKISSIWNLDLIENSIFIQILKILSKKKIEFVEPQKCDLLFIGPHDSNKIRRRFLNYFLKKTKKFNFERYFNNIDIYSLRKYKPLRIFFSYEDVKPNDSLTPNSEFSITSILGISDENHLRFPLWKEYIDWSKEGIIRALGTLHSKRFGSYYDLEKMLRPQNNFLTKKKSFCFFTSHLKEPRKSLYYTIQKKFPIEGFGPYFDHNILNHDKSHFVKKEIMERYAFNLCPENTLSPGFYTEKIPDSFLGGCLPVSWVDNNVNIDFNPNSFVNLLNYVQDDYQLILDLLKDHSFLKKFSTEPLLLKKVDLSKEFNFISRVLQHL
jgi:hypothetical protein